MKKPKSTTLAFGVSCSLLLLLDQGTKGLVMRHLQEGQDTLPIIDGLLLLEHARNTGGAFSMLEGQILLFGVVTVIAMGALVHLLRQLEETRGGWWQAVALGIIASGALGNGLDRLWFGSVTDFIRVYTTHPTLARWMVSLTGANAWPTFNVADVALVLGVALSITATLLFPEPRPSHRSAT